MAAADVGAGAAAELADTVDRPPPPPLLIPPPLPWREGMSALPTSVVSPFTRVTLRATALPPPPPVVCPTVCPTRGSRDCNGAAAVGLPVASVRPLVLPPGPANSGDSTGRPSRSDSGDGAEALEEDEEGRGGRCAGERPSGLPRDPTDEGVPRPDEGIAAQPTTSGAGATRVSVPPPAAPPNVCPAPWALAFSFGRHAAAPEAPEALPVPTVAQAKAGDARAAPAGKPAGTMAGVPGECVVACPMLLLLFRALPPPPPDACEYVAVPVADEDAMAGLCRARGASKGAGCSSTSSRSITAGRLPFAVAAAEAVFGGGVMPGLMRGAACSPALAGFTGCRFFFALAASPVTGELLLLIVSLLAAGERADDITVDEALGKAVLLW